MTTESTAAIPDHVPPELVGRFNLYTSPEMAPRKDGDPHAALSVLHDGPRVFYASQTTRDASCRSASRS